ncbi:MAG: hypothetical protein H8E20_14865, partial [Verrucomicrobia bacterium]|nr:hypothetical protein [Verrucomicrobiota bacterium]
MSHWSFAASLMMILAGIGVVVLAAWLGWGNWQRNGRRGRVALLEAPRLAAAAMPALPVLAPAGFREAPPPVPPPVGFLPPSPLRVPPR